MSEYAQSLVIQQYIDKKMDRLKKAGIDDDTRFAVAGSMLDGMAFTHNYLVHVLPMLGKEVAAALYEDFEKELAALRNKIQADAMQKIADMVKAKTEVNK